MNASASRAARTMSSSNAGSRSTDGLAIEGLRLAQNVTSADVVATGFDGLPAHQIHGPPQQTRQGLREVEVLLEPIRAARPFERDQEVGVAGFRVEVRPPRGRAEHFQPPHAVAAAESGDLVATLFDRGVHGVPIIAASR